MTNTTKLKFGSSKGHLAEYLLGAAITAKFVKGPELINKEDVTNILSITSLSDDLVSVFVDNNGNNIEFINIINNVKNIADAKEWQHTCNAMSTEMQAIIAFVNTDNSILQYSNLFFNNNSKNYIKIKAIGEESQKSTKADILLTHVGPCNTEKVLKGWSLKNNSNRIGQASPRTFENMQDFVSFLGIKLTPIDGYNDNPKSNIKNILKQAAYALESQDKSVLMHNLIRFITEHATKQDSRIDIINIKNCRHSVQSIRKLAAMLTSVDIEVIYDQIGKPRIRIQQRNNPSNILCQIRYTHSPQRLGSDGKLRAERHRLVVETGSLFKQLGSISA